jgi:hypothetical protein
MKPVISLTVWAFSAFFAPHAAAQTHAGVLTWQDNLNPAGTTYNILREQPPCYPNAFVTIATGVAALTFTDTTVSTGAYCWEVKAVLNNVLSPASNVASAVVPAFAPVNLGVQISHARHCQMLPTKSVFDETEVSESI